MQKESGQFRSDSGSGFLYLQIADRLRCDMDSGLFSPGSRLPSLDTLAALHGVNRLTARKAVSELCREGRAFSIPAKGTYVRRHLANDFTADAVKEKPSPVFGLLSHVLHPAGYGLYHQTMISGLYDELNKSDANLLVIAASVIEQEKLSALMRRSNANAMIYLGQFDKSVLADMVANGPPAVLLDYTVSGLNCDSIYVDNVGGASEAIQHLFEMGYRSEIAVISGAPEDQSTLDRLKGVKKAFVEAGIAFKGVHVVSGGYRREGGEAAMGSLLLLEPCPRAVFCMNDEMAAGAMEAIRNAGLRVPADIAVMGFDDSMWAESTNPQLTTMRVDARQMGRMAMRLLQARIGNPEATPTSTKLQPMLVKRGSA